MKAFTLKTVLVSVDKSSKNVDKVTKSFQRMTRNVTIESKTASFSFQSFARGVGMQSKKAIVSLNNLDASLNRTFRGISKKLGNLGLFAGFALFAMVLRSAGKAILDYESKLVGVGKTTGVENDELKLLGLNIVKTSNALKTVKTDTLLELAGAAGQLGVTGSDNLLKFAATMAKLEKASDIAGEEGAKSIARLLTITKEGPAVVDKFAASLVALGNTSAASESEILSVASEVGRATAAYSLHSDEILGISAALKSLDVAPESAGSAIGKVFREIELATLKGGENLQRFGKVMQLTSEEVTKVFKESPQKAFSLFIKGLGRINNEGGSVAKTLIDVELSGERVSKGIIPLATNYELLEDKIKLSQKAFEENLALDKEFEASQKTIKSAINSIVRAYENLFITQAVAGSKMEKVQKVLFYIGDNLGKIFTVIGALIGAFIAFKAVVILSNAALVTYNIVMGITGALFGTMTRSIALNAVALTAYKVATVIATAAQWLLNTAFYGFPLVWILAAIIAVVAGIILLVKHWDKVRDAMIKVYEKIKNSPFAILIFPIIAVVEAIKLLISSFKQIRDAFKFGSMADGFKAIGMAILNFVIQPVKMLLSALSKIPGLGKFAQSGLDKINAFQKRNAFVKPQGVIDKTKKENEISSKTATTPIIDKTKNLTDALDKNSDSLDKNTEGAKQEWTGRFRTTILKDYNYSGATSKMAQREIATTAIQNEYNVINDQKAVTPESVVTQSSSINRGSKPINGTITVNVVDKTGGNFALEVHGTGVNVVTTGNV